MEWVAMRYFRAATHHGRRSAKMSAGQTAWRWIKCAEPAI